MAELSVGSRTPEFTLPDQQGRRHRLADYRGRWVLLYCYPKDDTPGCTKEACSLRDHFTAFRRDGAVVLGLSKDSVSSHERFATKYRLPFPLLADESLTVLKAYGAWGKKAFLGKAYFGIFRRSFLIDPQGRLAKIYPHVKPDRHAQEVLADLKAIQESSDRR